MIVAVTGGRNYADRQQVAATLSRLPIHLLIHGAASGADTLAAEWAEETGIAVKACPADWDDIDTPPVRIGVTSTGKPYNKLAGFARNVLMLESGGDALVVFAGGKGTAHCHREAVKRGIRIIHPEPPKGDPQ